VVWGIIISLSAAAAALTVYALWPWATARQPQFIYRTALTLLGLAILVGPAVAYYRTTEQPNVAADNIPLMIGDSKGFKWDGPVGDSGNNPPQADTSLETVTAGLAKKLESQPDNINGWVLLARSYVALGNVDKAKKIFADLTAKWPKNVEVRVAYGEMLMAAANGKITPEARKAFEAGVAANPAHTRAQYDLALADSQAGKDKAAYDRWLTLAKSAPAGAPWLPEVAARLRETASKLKIPAPEIALSTPAPAPTLTPAPALTTAPHQEMPKVSPEQMRAADNMTPAERQAFIGNMVDGLAKKLKHNPNDLQGWLRLGRSYGVLGEWQKAKTAYQDGLKAFPGNADLAQALANIPASNP
jgi:cytochrome c-type biogenesis protein CcmH